MHLQQLLAEKSLQCLPGRRLKMFFASDHKWMKNDIIGGKKVENIKLEMNVEKFLGDTLKN